MALPILLTYAAYAAGAAALSFLASACGNQSKETKSDSESLPTKNPDGKDVGSKSFPNPAHNSITRAIYNASSFIPISGCSFPYQPELKEEELSRVLPQKDSFVNLCLKDTQRTKSRSWWKSDPDLKSDCTKEFWWKFNEELRIDKKDPKDINIKYVKYDDSTG